MILLEPLDVAFIGVSTGILASAGILIYRSGTDIRLTSSDVKPGEVDGISRVRQARATRAPVVDYYKAMDELGMVQQPADSDDRTEELGRAFLAATARSSARAELTAQLEDAVAREDYEAAAKLKSELDEVE